MRRAIAASAAAAALVLGLGASPARAQEFYLGQVLLVGFGYCPVGTTAADGGTLSIAQNSALYSLYGTTFGGDGLTTFGLPDLRGRAPIHLGQGPGLSDYRLGQSGGSETRTLSVEGLPTHTHPATGRLHGVNAPASTPSPAGALPALATGSPVYGVVPEGGATVEMAPQAVTVAVESAGGGQPVDIRQPYIAMRYCVALFGIFPPRP